MAAATTERKLHVAGPTRSPVRRGGPDRITVFLLGLTAFLLVLALLASQLTSSTAKSAAQHLVVRRVYQTTVIETIHGGGSGTSMSQSVSSSGSAGSTLAAPVTRSSG